MRDTLYQWLTNPITIVFQMITAVIGIVSGIREGILFSATIMISIEIVYLVLYWLVVFIINIVSKKRQERPLQDKKLQVKKVVVADEKICTVCGYHFSNVKKCPRCGTVFQNTVVYPNDAQLAGPWIRWAARMLDFRIEYLVMFTFLTVLYVLIFCRHRNIDIDSGFILGIIAIPCAFILDTLIYSIFGNTLGKLLFGIKIVNQSEIQISNKNYLLRNLLVYVIGFGLCIPLIHAIAWLVQSNQVYKDLPTTYDRILKVKSIRWNANRAKPVVGIILLILFTILNYYGGGLVALMLENN